MVQTSGLTDVGYAIAAEVSLKLVSMHDERSPAYCICH